MIFMCLNFVMLTCFSDPRVTHKSSQKLCLVNLRSESKSKNYYILIEKHLSFLEDAQSLYSCLPLVVYARVTHRTFASLQVYLESKMQFFFQLQLMFMVIESNDTRFSSFMCYTFSMTQMENFRVLRLQ